METDLTAKLVYLTEAHIGGTPNSRTKNGGGDMTLPTAESDGPNGFAGFDGPVATDPRPGYQ